MSIGSSPEPGIIRSLFLDKNGFERVVFVLLLGSGENHQKVSVGNSQF